MHHRSADGSTWFVAPAMAAALSRVLTVGGATAALAILESALIGPTQVAARLVEFGLLHVRIPSRGRGCRFAAAQSARRRRVSARQRRRSCFALLLKRLGVAGLDATTLLLLLAFAALVRGGVALKRPRREPVMDRSR